MRRALAGLAITTALCSGCALFGVDVEADEVRREEGATRIQSVSIADDRRSLRVGFVGAAEFDPDDLCTASYEAAVAVVDGQLQIGVFALEHPKPPQEGDACTLEGYPRELTIELPEPFFGAAIRDVTGPVLELEAP
jgi:hypothetical protein